MYASRAGKCCASFNGHPPLGVNATLVRTKHLPNGLFCKFQWAPTLGGECYATGSSIGALGTVCFNGHPPLGVNATVGGYGRGLLDAVPVSMGTHPWG